MENHAVKNIVSMLPSATEIVCALGYREALVGRSHECDFPAGVETLPVCTAPRMDPAGSSLEIDREVRSLLHEALSIYDLDVGRLEALQPEVIVTQTQCDVCAVSLEQVEQAAAQCLRDDTRLVALEPVSLDAVWDDMRKVAAALNVPERGETLVTGLKERMEAIAARAAGPEELIEADDSGVLVPLEDAGALAAGIRTVLSDDALRDALTVQGRRSFETSYTEATIVERYRTLFEALAETPAG